MVELIDMKIKGFLTRLADHGHWMFLGCLLVAMVIATWQSLPSGKAKILPDTRTMQFWNAQMRLRTRIDHNLEETAELLACLVTELEKEDCETESLLAQIRQKRVELDKLARKLENMRERTAKYEKSRQAKKPFYWGERQANAAIIPE